MEDLWVKLTLSRWPLIDIASEARGVHKLVDKVMGFVQSFFLLQELVSIEEVPRIGELSNFLIGLFKALSVALHDTLHKL